MTLDDASFTTEVAIHSGGDAIAPYRRAVLLNTGSPQTFIRRDALDHMTTGRRRFVSVRAAQQVSFLGWVSQTFSFTDRDPHPPGRPFFREKAPTCSLTVWAYVFLPSVMQHAVLPGRDSWMPFNTGRTAPCLLSTAR